ncbi:MAG: patatin-like phospholipase family protein, partial [Actinobacteria bacterium]|nr:patatin-like phospholipase family protein [Actinomycetota bacterium]
KIEVKEVIKKMVKKRIKIGVALSGGAARGLSHIGVLEVLEGLGLEIYAIAGTSMGSIIGSFYCSGITLEEMESYVNSMDWRSFLLFSDLDITRTGVINGRRVEEVLKKFLNDRNFSDCLTGFCCVAVDLIKREKVIITEGQLMPAVRASISIPGFFSPVCMDRAVLVDGGVIEPLPTASLKEVFNPDFIIASSITFKRDSEKYSKLDLPEIFNDCPSSTPQPDGENSGIEGLKKRLPGFLKKRKKIKKNNRLLTVNSVLDSSLNIIHREMTRSSRELADVVIEPEVGDYGFFDLTRGSDIIRRGRKAALEKVEEIRSKLDL